MLVESKVVGALDPGQWAAHRARLNAGGSQVLLTLIRTWPGVYVFFKELQHDRGEILDAQSRFLISQFTEYLELIGQAKFSGVPPELFDDFSRPDDDVKPRLRGVMTALAREVLEALRLAKLNQGFYEDFRVGNLWQGDDHIWAAFGPRDRGYRDVAHQTLTLNAHGLDIFVNVELASTAAKLQRRLHDDRSTFRDILAALLPGEPFCVEVWERIHRRASFFDYHLVDTVRVGPPA